MVAHELRPSGERGIGYVHQGHFASEIPGDPILAHQRAREDNRVIRGSETYPQRPLGPAPEHVTGWDDPRSPGGRAAADSGAGV